MCCDDTHHDEGKDWMDCCCPDMTEEDKQKWMKDVHRKMHHMKAHGGHMMGMMHRKMHEKGIGPWPWDMCKEIVSALHQSHKVATMATPEVQGLFEDWVEQIEKEILAYLKDKDSIDVKKLATQFKISKESAYFFLTKLAQKGKVNLQIKKD